MKQAIHPTAENSKLSGEDVSPGQRLPDIAQDIPYSPELSEAEIWSTHNPPVWRAGRFVGRPHFYPVYRFRDCYCYCPLPLIVLKGYLALNARVAGSASRRGYLYYSGRETIDREIHRVGGPARPTFRLKDPAEFVRLLAQAMKADVEKIESLNAGYTNIVLCGGKDSLNLLLLPWKNPVLAASAPPNYELVRDFISENKLGLETVVLHDEPDEATLRAAVLANCCLMDLEHCRWGTDLRALAEGCDKRAVFWAGAMADALTTPKWRNYAYAGRSGRSVGSRVLKRLRRLLPKTVSDPYTMRRLYRTCWRRGAMWQGVSLSVIRQITGCLTVSGYHGGRAGQVLCEIDLSRVADADIRPMIGEQLAGRSLRYPATNPSPPVCKAQAGLAGEEVFLKALAEMGITAGKPAADVNPARRSNPAE